MVTITGLLIAAVISIVIYRFFLKKNGKNLPPGPSFSWPLVGNMLQLRGHMHVKISEWASTYGEIFQFGFGTNRCYVISDLELLKEVFNHPHMNDRPDDKNLTLVTKGPHGVINSSGQEWVDQRRFTLRNLRDFGFGKASGEELITTEVHEFLGKFSTQQGKPLILNKTFSAAVLNTLWQIMTGVRYDQDDPRLWGIFRKQEEMMELGAKNPLAFLAPRIAKMFPDFSGWNKIMDLVDSMQGIVSGHVDDHKKTQEEEGDDASRDFIDVYLKEIEATSDSQSSFYKDNGIRSLKAVIIDLFSAGFETVTLTLSWAVLYLTTHPEVQKQLQDEMDKVVGRNRPPTLADRPSLPYVEATIAETLRYSSIAPIGVFHMAGQDTKLRGYDVPKRTFIIGALHHIHFSEKYFPNPKDFNPGRYMTADGRYQKSDSIMAFGYGKRACLGETLARDEVFLFLTNLFHRYSIRLADENPNPSFEPKKAFLLAPQDFKVVMTERS